MDFGGFWWILVDFGWISVDFGGFRCGTGARAGVDPVPVLSRFSDPALLEFPVQPSPEQSGQIIPSQPGLCNNPIPGAPFPFLKFTFLLFKNFSVYLFFKKNPFYFFLIFYFPFKNFPLCFHLKFP